MIGGLQRKELVAREIELGSSLPVPQSKSISRPGSSPPDGLTYSASK